MASNGAVYNHRSLQPTTRSTQGPGQQPVPVPISIPIPVLASTKLTESLEAIKQEFEIISSDRDAVRVQRDEYEAKINSQINEVNVIRRSLYDLEAQQGKARQHYEEELNRLRSEIALLRQGGTPSATAGLSSTHIGTPRLGSTPIALADSFLRNRDRERARERGRGLTPPDCEHERDRVRERDPDREADRVTDQRDPKRLRPERIRADRTDRSPPLPPGSSRGLPPAHTLYATSGPSSISLNIPALDPPEYLVTLPPISAGLPNGAPEELSLQSATPEFRKEGSDWFAVFNPKTKRVLDISLAHTLTHASVVCCVQFSSDGKYLATGCNRTAQIYDVKTGAKICVLTDDLAGKSGDLYIRSVRFSPDGKLLATGAEDRKIRIWDIAKRHIRNIFDGHQQEIYSLDFSKDGRLIVSGSGDKTARIWDMMDCSSRVLTIDDPDSINSDAGVTSVAISPNGQMVAAGSLDTIVRIWDSSTGVLLDRLRGHRDSVYSVAFTPDGKGLVSGSLDKTLKYWNVGGLATRGIKGRKEGANDTVKKPGDKPNHSPCTMDFVGHKDYVLSVAVSHDGQWVVSGSKDRCVQFWDSRTATLQFMLQGHKNSVISLDVNPSGSLLATGSGDSLARIWRYSTI